MIGGVLTVIVGENQRLKDDTLALNVEDAEDEEKESGKFIALTRRLSL